METGLCESLNLESDIESGGDRSVDLFCTFVVLAHHEKISSESTVTTPVFSVLSHVVNCSFSNTT